MTHGPQVISAVIVTGRRQKLLIGVYLPPSEQAVEHADTLHQILTACDRFPRLPRIFLGDLNVDLREIPHTPWETAVHDTLAEAGLKDLSHFFQPIRRFWQGYTWKCRREETLIRSRCDYILVDDERMWRGHRLVQPRGIDSDHLMLQTFLALSSTGTHQQYVRQRRAIPISWNKTTGTNAILEGCRRRRISMSKRSNLAIQWTSDQTWKLVDTRGQGRRQGTLTGEALRLLNRKI